MIHIHHTQDRNIPLIIGRKDLEYMIINRKEKDWKENEQYSVTNKSIVTIKRDLLSVLLIKMKCINQLMIQEENTEIIHASALRK